MTYAGKPLAQVLAEGADRMAEQAERMQGYRQAHRQMRWRQSLILGAVFLVFQGLSGWSWNTGWPAVIGSAAGILGGWTIATLNLGILTGMLVAGAVALPGFIACFVWGHLGENQASQISRMLMLFFWGLGVPVIAGAVSGWRRQTWDRDHLLV